MKLTNKFPNKRWTKSSINRLLKKLGDTGAVNNSQIAADHEENVDLVNDLVLSQKDTSQTHRTVRENLIIS